MKINKKITSKLFYVLAVGASIFFLFFFIVDIWIGYEAKRICQEAKWEYHKKTCVDSLIAVLEDEKQGFRVRNNAIWALGQLGDKKALPVLEKYYTGIIPDKEPLDNMISQYELKKAINLIKGGLNIAGWAWRWGVK